MEDRRRGQVVLRCADGVGFSRRELTNGMWGQVDGWGTDLKATFRGKQRTFWKGGPTLTWTGERAGSNLKEEGHSPRGETSEKEGR